ncbi:hypothetical protein Tco_0438747 [Tanacetum coccineum]
MSILSFRTCMGDSLLPSAALLECNYGVLGRYDVYVPALTKDHEGNKNPSTPYRRSSIRPTQEVQYAVPEELNTPYPRSPIHRTGGAQYAVSRKSDTSYPYQLKKILEYFILGAYAKSSDTPCTCKESRSFTISELKTKLENVEKGKSVNTKFGKHMVSNKLHGVTPLNKQVFQKKTDVLKAEDKHVLSKTVTLQTSPNKQKVVETNQNVIAPGMYKVYSTKKQEPNTNKAKSVLPSTGLRADSSVRRPSNRDSPFKNSVLSNTKKSSEKVEVYVRTNKKTNVASKNVVSDKKIVIDVDVKNALKAKDVLCVACAKNVLIPCHDKCLANYNLNVHSKVRRALFTTPRTTKSTFEDTTSVVLKTIFSVKTIQSKSLDT